MGVLVRLSMVRHHAIVRFSKFTLSAGPFDAIHVGAASPGNKVPSILVDQLAQPGRMFIPVGNLTQYIEQVDKGEGGDVHQERIMGVRVSPFEQTVEKYDGILTLSSKYVPLTDPPKPNN